MNDFGIEKECPVCHKRFLVCCEPAAYGWQHRGELFCSYTCMRRVEVIAAERESKGTALRKIPPELYSTWRDMVTLQAYSKKYNVLRRKKYSDAISEEVKQKLPALIAECNKRVERLKSKYGYGIGKLGKSDFELIYRFAICGWGRERLIKETGYTYDELCDRFENILRSLQRYLTVGIYKRRWICG